MCLGTVLSKVIIIIQLYAFYGKRRQGSTLNRNLLSFLQKDFCRTTGVPARGKHGQDARATVIRFLQEALLSLLSVGFSRSGDVYSHATLDS